MAVSNRLELNNPVLERIKLAAAERLRSDTDSPSQLNNITSVKSLEDAVFILLGYSVDMTSCRERIKVVGEMIIEGLSDNEFLCLMHTIDRSLDSFGQTKSKVKPGFFSSSHKQKQMQEQRMLEQFTGTFDELYCIFRHRAKRGGWIKIAQDGTFGEILFGLDGSGRSNLRLKDPLTKDSYIISISKDDGYPIIQRHSADGLLVEHFSTARAIGIASLLKDKLESIVVNQGIENRVI